MEYKPEKVEELAKKINNKATNIVIAGSIVGVLVGLLAFATGFAFVSEVRGTETALLAGGVAGLLVFLLFYSRAKSRAFMLEVQANAILCFTQLEKNTRTKEA